MTKRHEQFSRASRGSARMTCHGKKFLISESGFKPWPCSGIAIPYIEATLKLVHGHGIRPQDIDEIVVTVGDMANLLCDRLQERQNPQTTMDAKWSIPFIVAVAAQKGQVRIGDFSPNGIKDPEVLRLAKKVTPQFDAQLTRGGRGWIGVPPAVVEIKTQGKQYSSRIDVPLGCGTNPMTKEQHIEKFKDCASYSRKQLSTTDIERVIQLVDQLEEVKDVSEIMRIIS